MTRFYRLALNPKTPPDVLIAEARKVHAGPDAWLAEQLLKMDNAT